MLGNRRDLVHTIHSVSTLNLDQNKFKPDSTPSSIYYCSELLKSVKPALPEINICKNKTNGPRRYYQKWLGFSCPCPCQGDKLDGLSGSPPAWDSHVLSKSSRHCWAYYILCFLKWHKELIIGIARSIPPSFWHCICGLTARLLSNNHSSCCESYIRQELKYSRVMHTGSADHSSCTKCNQMKSNS